jgi:membrane protease YdiL (CAAX protease family)
MQTSSIHSKSPGLSNRLIKKHEEYRVDGEREAIMSKENIFQRYPVAIYFIMAYAISWGGSFAIGGPKFLRGEPLGLADALRMGPLVIAGPCIAGILMTYLVDGKSGLRDLLARMAKWRVSLRWYAAALLIFPLLILAVLLTLSSLVSPIFSPNFLSFGIVLGLFAGFFEEIGWTGFAYPRMQGKYGTLRAAIFLALLHGVWHIFADYLGESQSSGGYWFIHFFVMWMVGMTAMRIILVWIYSNTGSLLLAQLTHASSTAFLIVLAPVPISPANETLWWAIYALVLWIVAIVIIAKYGSQLVKSPQPTKMRIILSSDVQ